MEELNSLDKNITIISNNLWTEKTLVKKIENEFNLVLKKRMLALRKYKERF